MKEYQKQHSNAIVEPIKMTSICERNDVAIQKNIITK